MSLPICQVASVMDRPHYNNIFTIAGIADASDDVPNNNSNYNDKYC